MANVWVEGQSGGDTGPTGGKGDIDSRAKGGLNCCQKGTQGKTNILGTLHGKEKKIKTCLQGREKGDLHK